MIRHGFAVSVLVVVILTVASGCRESGAILRVSDGTRLIFEEWIREISSEPSRPDMLFVGELHDRRDHHQFQAAVIEALAGRGLSLAVGLEMFRRESQEHLDAWVAGRLTEEEFREVYASDWSVPFSLYREIFIVARDRGIPLIALNVPSGITRQVARGGFDSLSKSERGELPRIRCVVDPEYEAFIRRALAMHGHGGMEFEYFCEAQLVWDVSMAMRLLDYHEKRPERLLVVLAGGGHAWKRGIPAQVAKEADVSMVTILPEIDGRLEEGNATPADTDYLWLD